MAEYTKVHSFTEALAKKKIDLSGTLKVALTNTAHNNAWSKLSDLTEVSYTYCSSRNLTVVSASQNNGLFKLVLQDLTLTASGGNVGPFRYVYIYDDGATDKDLICYYDYGESITVHDGENLNIDFDGTNGVLTIE